MTSTIVEPQFYYQEIWIYYTIPALLDKYRVLFSFQQANVYVALAAKHNMELPLQGHLFAGKYGCQIMVLTPVRNYRKIQR